MRRGTAAFDVIRVEALDRLSRDQEDLAGLWKRLNFLGIELRAVHDGKAPDLIAAYVETYNEERKRLAAG